MVAVSLKQWDLINSALQRANSSSRGGSEGGGAGAGGISISDASSFARLLAAGNPKLGVALCDGDKRILYMNEKFEEMTGIRVDAAIGQDFTAVARDQSLGAFIADLFDRASAALGGEMPAEDYDFSGTPYKVSASAFSGSAMGGAAQCYLLVATPAGGSE